MKPIPVSDAEDNKDGKGTTNEVNRYTNNSYSPANI